MGEENPIRQSRDEHGRAACLIPATPLDQAMIPAPPTRKVSCAMILMQQSSPQPRRLRAALIGFGLDNGDDEQRLTRGDQTLIFGGSAETHAELQETALKMEQELNRRGQDLGDLDPIELAELATVIESPGTPRNRLATPGGPGAPRSGVRRADRRGADRPLEHPRRLRRPR